MFITHFTTSNHIKLRATMPNAKSINTGAGVTKENSWVTGGKKSASANMANVAKAIQLSWAPNAPCPIQRVRRHDLFVWIRARLASASTTKVSVLASSSRSDATGAKNLIPAYVARSSKIGRASCRERVS